MKIFCLNPQEPLMLQQIVSFWHNIMHLSVLLFWVCVCVCDHVIFMMMSSGSAWGLVHSYLSGKKQKTSECLSRVTWHVSISPDYYSHFLFDLIFNCVKVPAYVTAHPPSPTPKTTRPECSCKAGALIWCSVENGWLFHSNTEGLDLPMKKWLCVT